MDAKKVGIFGEILEAIVQISEIPTHASQVYQEGIRYAITMVDPPVTRRSVYIEGHSLGGLLIANAFKRSDLSADQLRMIDLVFIRIRSTEEIL